VRAVTKLQRVCIQVKPNAIKENRAFLGRPTSERNASFGAQQFCELTMLEKLDYVRDDTMFIKVQIDMDEMPTI
jgi:TNF receptor-associated factor 4